MIKINRFDKMFFAILGKKIQNKLTKENEINEEIFNFFAYLGFSIWIYYLAVILAVVGIISKDNSLLICSKVAILSSMLFMCLSYISGKKNEEQIEDFYNKQLINSNEKQQEKNNNNNLILNNELMFTSESREKEMKVYNIRS